MTLTLCDLCLQTQLQDLGETSWAVQFLYYNITTPGGINATVKTYCHDKFGHWCLGKHPVTAPTACVCVCVCVQVSSKIGQGFDTCQPRHLSSSQFMQPEWSVDYCVTGLIIWCMVKRLHAFVNMH